MRCACHYTVCIWRGCAVRKTQIEPGQARGGEVFRLLNTTTHSTPHYAHTQERIMTARHLQLRGLPLLVLVSFLASQAVLALSTSPPPRSSRSSRSPQASLTAFAFASLRVVVLLPTRARHHPQQQAQGRQRRSASLQMRDASMTRDFTVGDIVRVEPGVQLDGMDWGGLEGTVTTTWVK